MQLRERVMRALGELVVRRYRVILPIGVGLAVLAFWGASQISVKTQLKDMMNPENPRVKAYDQISSIFGSGSILMTIEGGDKIRLAAAAEELASMIERSPEVRPHIRSVNLKMDKDFISRWALMMQKPEDLEKTRSMFSRVNLLPFMRNVNDNLERTYTGGDAEEDLETGKQENEAVSSMNRIQGFAERLTDYLTHSDDGAASARGLADSILFGDLYMYNPDGTMILFAVNTTIDLSKEMESADLVTAGVKAAIAEVRPKYPELNFGYTGDVGIQADENEAISSDTTLPSLLAYGLVLALFLFSFRQIRAILFAMIALAIGILYDYGIVGVVLGELNLLTSAGAALLVGMGIDYGIQFTTSFTSFEEEGHPPEEAIRLTFRKSGIGILLAAASTSASFLVLLVSTSKGFFQLGIVAGLGILTCFLAMVLVLPSLLLRFGKRRKGETRIPQIDWRALEAIGSFAARHRLAVLGVAAALTIGALFAAFGLRGEFNMLELEPQRSVSIVTHRRIIEKFGINPYSALALSNDLERTREMTEALENTPRVSQVDSITALIPAPADQDARLAEIALFRKAPERVSPTEFGTKQLTELIAEIQRLEWNMIELGDLSIAGLGDDNEIVKKRNDMIREIVGGEAGRPGKEVFRKLIAALEAAPEISAARLASLDGPFARAMNESVERLSALTRRIGIEDLPTYLADTYFDETRTYNLITIYPEAGALDEEAGLRRFDADLRDISSSITGLAPLTLAFFDEIFAEAKKTAVTVGVLVLLLAYLTFRNVRDTIVVAVPVVVGMILLFGLASLLGWKINALNLITLPLNIGIGIAYGTYMIQRYLLEDRNVGRAMRYTTKAIFLSAFTTVLGFGSLGLVGSFKMISSFGNMLAVGIAFSFVTTLVILPALLAGEKRAARAAASAKGVAI